ncbi:MAG TPA: ATP-binding protein [Bacteroidetes bacterium]|nr:ATP-binding protein [Bacteroidota bacterium]
MVFKNFRLIVISRILILAATIFLFFFTLNQKYTITTFLVGLVVVLEIYSLIRYVDRTNRDLTSFLESIRFSEFTRSFQVAGMGSSFDELNRAFNAVIKDFKAVRSQREEHYQYLQSIVQNVDISIITYQRDGTVELINKAARNLFQITSLKNIHSLKKISPELVDTLLDLKPGINRLVKIKEDDDILQLAISGTEFRIHDKVMMLTTIKDIQNVLEEQETEAWQKLIRVLTHEIMNSITPIASLSSTLDIMLKGVEGKDGEKSLNEETVEEIQKALQTINKRSTGLLHFVNTYRNLTRIPKPNFKVVKVNDMCKNIRMLMEEELKNNQIELSSEIIPEDLDLYADEELIEQVLINLIKNSIHALEGKSDAKIRVRAFVNKRGRVSIQVMDNGPGILPDVLDKIFIPFFTTKPRGSGIGLSLSKQILRLHGGTISASSEPDKETVFTLTF